MHKDSQDQDKRDPLAPGVGAAELVGFTKIRKDSQGFTRAHKDPPGFTRTHKDSQGFTRIHTSSQGFTEIHKVHKIRRIHTDSQDQGRREPLAPARHENS